MDVQVVMYLQVYVLLLILESCTCFLAILLYHSNTTSAISNNMSDHVTIICVLEMVRWPIYSWLMYWHYDCLSFQVIYTIR